MKQKSVRIGNKVSGFFNAHSTHRSGLLSSTQKMEDSPHALEPKGSLSPVGFLFGRGKAEPLIGAKERANVKIKSQTEVNVVPAL